MNDKNKNTESLNKCDGERIEEKRNEANESIRNLTGREKKHGNSKGRKKRKN